MTDLWVASDGSDAASDHIKQSWYVNVQHTSRAAHRNTWAPDPPPKSLLLFFIIKRATMIKVFFFFVDKDEYFGCCWT